MPLDALNRLPVDSRPDLAARATLQVLSVSIGKACKVLAPPVWKRALGGITKDQARAVVAVCLEETRACRNTITDIRKSARLKPEYEALVGSCERLLALLDQWRNTALEFEEAVYGSDTILLGLSRRLLRLCSEIKSPAGGLA